MHGLLNDIGLAIISATLLGLLSHLLRQPIILGYFVAGALIGPKVGFGFIHDSESIELIAEIGLILLLFVIGLEINLKDLLKSGKQLLYVGLTQVPLCAMIGLVLVPLLGVYVSGEPLEPLYFALLCSLSSTAVVVKLLYDKGEFDTLPGRLTLGVLVVQDLFAILILALQPNFAALSIVPVAKALGASCALLVVGFLVSHFVLQRIFQMIAKTPEMVVSVSLGWCTLVTAAADQMALSREMGALIAGLCISAFPYSIHVTAKTLPLRDFFLTLFFVSLGMMIDVPNVALIWPILATVLLVIATRFLTVYPVLMLAGAGRRASFITSLNLAQLSEFSLVIAGIGVGLKHISAETLGVFIFAMAILAVLSSYAIRYNHQLFLAYDRLLGRSDGESEPPQVDLRQRHPIILLGYFRAARSFIETVAEEKPELLKQVLVIDFNPLSIEELHTRGVAAIFGDIGSLDTLHHAHLEEARIIASTIPDMLLKGTSNAALVLKAKTIAPQALVIATADDPLHERQLRREGADEVLRPHDLMGRAIAEYVQLAFAAVPLEEQQL